MTSSAKSSTPNPPPPAATRPSWFSRIEMLTPSEIESLRQDNREKDAFYKKAFAGRKPKKAPKAV